MLANRGAVFVNTNDGEGVYKSKERGAGEREEGEEGPACCEEKKSWIEEAGRRGRRCVRGESRGIAGGGRGRNGVARVEGEVWKAEGELQERGS